MRTPADVLADLLRSDPARPRVTFYEDPRPDGRRAHRAQRQGARELGQQGGQRPPGGARRGPRVERAAGPAPALARALLGAGGVVGGRLRLPGRGRGRCHGHRQPRPRRAVGRHRRAHHLGGAGALRTGRGTSRRHRRGPRARHLRRPVQRLGVSRRDGPGAARGRQAHGIRQRCAPAGLAAGHAAAHEVGRARAGPARCPGRLGGRRLGRPLAGAGAGGPAQDRLRERLDAEGVSLQR